MIPTPHSTEVTEKAPENGSLGGHRVTCTCGATWTTSLNAAMASSEAMKHLEWHSKVGR